MREKTRKYKNDRLSGQPIHPGIIIYAIGHGCGSGFNVFVDPDPGV
jgi:hypothetical protein